MELVLKHPRLKKRERETRSNCHRPEEMKLFSSLRVSPVAQMLKNLTAQCRRPRFNP